MYDDEPKPKRRSALRHALGGLALLGCLVLNFWMLDNTGLIELRGWWRQSRALFAGRETMREHVFIGMAREEVEARIGEGRASSFITFSAPLRPASGPPRPPSPSEVQFTRVEYPEYGFDIVYNAPMSQIGGPHIPWKVVAVEDRK